MKTRGWNRIIEFLLCAAACLSLAGCNTAGYAPAAVESAPTAPVQAQASPAPDSEATLGSLEKIDDYPFYVMHYSGGYEYPLIRSAQSLENGFGCSLFAAMGETGDKFYGRNFDWDYSPALLLFTDPPDGYASASMVDLRFLGISPEESKTLNEMPLENRAALLDAPSMPFDGINENGLAVGMAAVPDAYIDDASSDPSRQTIGSIGIIRQVLDHARNVDEAVELFGRYNIQFSGGPPIHYLVADRSGKASLVEFYQGEMIVLPNEQPWHMATNHLRCIAQGDGGCSRYRTLSARLSTSAGQLDAQSAMQLLSEVKQDSTQWSTVYNMDNGDIYVVVGGKYATTYSFQLELSQP